MPAISVRKPFGFALGGRLKSHQEQALTSRAGFEIGYPMYGIETFDPLRLSEVLSVINHKPGTGLRHPPQLGVAVVLAGGAPEVCSVDIRVRAVHHDFGSAPAGPFLYITGSVRRDDGTGWMVKGRKVYGYTIHLLITQMTGHGYLQFVPFGRSRKQHPPSSEGLWWATELPVFK